MQPNTAPDFLVAVPRGDAPVPRSRLPTARELRERYSFFHGAAPLPEEVRGAQRALW